MTEPAGEAAAPVGVAARITFSVSEAVVECPAGSTVLAAARAAGVKLPFKCGKGVCGTCKSKLLSGTVAMRHGGGIRPREVAAGMILTCCSQPLEDLVIER